MKIKKILFLPSDFGGGLGHVSRCVALANILTKNSYQSTFVLTQKTSKNFVKNYFPTIQLPRIKLYQKLFRDLSLSKGDERSIAYSIFDGIAFQFIRDEIYNVKTFEKILKHLILISRKKKPDLIIGDNHLFAATLGKIFDIPVVQIVRYINHPNTRQMIWWKDYSHDIKSINVLSFVNEVLEKYHLPALEDERGFLRGDLYFVPSVPEIEPIDNSNSHTHFIGPLIFEENYLRNRYRDMLEFENGRKLIYFTLGGGAQHVRQTNIISILKEQLQKLDFNYIIADPTWNNSIIPPGLNNIKIYPWVPGWLIINACDLVIFHGGYNTFMEVLTAGKPGLVLPFHSEQEGNGRRLKSLGCGDFLLPYKEEDLEVVKGKIDGLEFQYLASNKFDLKLEEISSKVDFVINNPEVKRNNQKLKKALKEYSAQRVDRIVRAIQKL